MKTNQFLALVLMVCFNSISWAQEEKLHSVKSEETTLSIKGKRISLPEVALTGSYEYFESDKTKLPVIMVPGLGLSSYIFTNTPDNRASWAETFSQQGHDVYVYNDPSIFVNPNLDYSEYQNQASKWQAQRAWNTWGMGSRYPEAYENTRYPTEQFDQLLESFPLYTSFAFLQTSNAQGARGGGGGRSRGGSDDLGTMIKVNNLQSLIDKVGDCILMVHSMSGVIGFETIRQNSEHIKGFIVIEPVGSSTSPEDIKKHFSHIPFLGVYGDYIDQRRQRGRKEAVEETIKLIKSNNGSAEMLDLPAMGLEGNTHLLMQDNNNQGIAEMIIQWIEKTGK